MIVWLCAVHCAGLAYRGLSVGTVVLTEAGLVQLVDFRWACMAEAQHSTAQHSTAQHKHSTSTR